MKLGRFCTNSVFVLFLLFSFLKLHSNCHTRDGTLNFAVPPGFAWKIIMEHNCMISNDLYLTLKDNGILRTRGIRAGISQRLKHQQITALQRSERITNVPQHSSKGVNLNNLSYVKRGQEQHLHRFNVPGNLYFSEGINHIPVHITAKTNRPNYLRTRFLGNLTKVDIQRQQENRISASNKIKFALWNAQSLQKKIWISM